MKINLYHVCLYAVLFLFVNNIYAQPKMNLESLIPPAPNAAELGKYGTMPVGLLTGTPEISFPLYEISSGNLKLPITLSYHASGNQVNQRATDVGLSWSINAGGQISRTVYGARDDSQYGYFNYTPLTYSQLFAIDNYYTMESYANSAKDLEPDLFVYNVGSRSGKFIYNLNNQFVTIPFDPIKIEKISTGYNVSFKIIDDNGVIYKFENYGTVTPNSDNPITHRSTWYLTYMISSDYKDTIKFTYESFSIQDQIIQETYPIGKEVDCNSGTPFVKVVQGDSYGVIINKTINSQYTELFPKKIEFKGGVVEFKRETLRQDDYFGNQNKMLNKIVITNSANQTIKRFDFNQSYYIANVYNTQSSRYRLKLTGFSESGSDSTIKKNYYFDYNTTLLPGYGSKAMDYWGYYNGMDSNNSLIPATTIQSSEINSVSFATAGSYNNNMAIGSFSFGSGSREPNETSMKAGILTKITYPTGGYTLMDYEAHQYLSDINPYPTKIGGGLRIKWIKNYEKDNTLLTQEFYKYGQGENGLGVKIFDERNFYRNYEDIVKGNYIQSGGSVCILYSGPYWVRIFQGISKYNTLNYQGSPILYSSVTKYQGDLTNNAGKTVYYYNVFSEQIYMPDEFINSSNYGAINSNWRQGELKMVTTYAKSGSQYVPVSNITNEYTEFNKSTVSAIRIKQVKQFNKICTECWTLPTGPDPSSYYPGQGFFSIYQYPIPTGTYRKTKETKVDYNLNNPSDSIVSISNFQYSNSANRYLTESSVQLSESNALKITRLRYPNDFTETVYTSMVTKNILTPVIEEKTFRSISGNETLLTTSKTNYKEFYTNVFRAETVQSSIGSSSLIIDLTYDYNTSGKLTKATAKDGIVTNILWGYNNIYPVARVISGSDFSISQTIRNNIASRSFTGSYLKSSIDADINFLKGASALYSYVNNTTTYHVELYTYNPLIGITSKTDPTGIMIYYQYDSFGRLEYVKDHDEKLLKKNVYHYSGM